MLGGFGVLGDSGFLPVDVVVDVAPDAGCAAQVVAAQGAGSAFGGERFRGFPFLLGQGTSLGRGPRGPCVGGSGEQPGVGAGEGGIDLGPVSADRLRCGGSVQGAGGVELCGPLGP